MHLRFVESESTFAYFATTHDYLQVHGKPLVFYTDTTSIRCSASMVVAIVSLATTCIDARCCERFFALYGYCAGTR